MLFKLGPDINDCECLIYSKDKIFKTQKIRMNGNKQLEYFYTHEDEEAMVFEGSALELFGYYIVTAKDHPSMNFMTLDTLSVKWNIE